MKYLNASWALSLSSGLSLQLLQALSRGGEQSQGHPSLPETFSHVQEAPSFSQFTQFPQDLRIPLHRPSAMETVFCYSSCSNLTAASTAIK